MKLSEVKAGKKFSIGTREYIKLSGDDKQTICIAKDCVFDSTYGSNNNFAESKILKRLNEEILPEIEAAVGQENILEFETDLTSLDGLKTYGTMTNKISIPTFDMYRNMIGGGSPHRIQHRNIPMAIGAFAFRLLVLSIATLVTTTSTVFARFCSLYLLSLYHVRNKEYGRC